MSNLKIAVGILAMLLGLLGTGRAQLTGIKSIPGDYATFTAAVADLNAQGVGLGGVTFNVAAGYAEANVAAVLTVSTNPPNAAKPVIFRKSGAGANPLLTAAVGTSTSVDGIVILNGVDHVTFDGIDLQENAANTNPTTQMEWGYAVVKSSALNGCHHNTLKNCVVTLDKSNTASVGIYVGNHIATNTTSLPINNFLGTNSYNKFHNNTLQNCYQGVVLNGFASGAPFDFYDQNNEIGVDGISTRRSQIINFGGNTATANGISALHQNNLKVFSTTINNGGGAAQTGILNGILTSGGINTSLDIYNDTITLSSAATISSMTAIFCGSGSNGAGNSIHIYSNVVTSCSYPTATSGEFRGIATTVPASHIHIHNNTIANTTLAGNGDLSGIFCSNGSTTLLLNLDVHDNTLNGNTKTGSSGNLRLLNLDVSAAAIQCHSNIVSNNSNSLSVGTTHGYFNMTGTGFAENIYDNQIFNLAGGNGETQAIVASAGPVTAYSNKHISGNAIHDITGNTNAAFGGIVSDWGMSSNIYQNNIYNLTNFSNTGAGPAVFGIRVGTNNAVENLIYNNFISELKAPNAANSVAIRGLSLEGSAASTMRVYHNTVYLNASSVGGIFGTTPIHCGASPINYDLRDNIFVDLSTPAGPGQVVALSRGATSVANYSLQSGHNCLYAGIPGPNNVIHSDGTNSDQTLQAMKNRIGPREQASFSEIPPFLSLVSPYNLRLNPGSPTQCESGGQPIASVTTDVDGNIRNATAPDVGADEFTGIMNDIASPDIQYAPLTNGNVAPNRVIPAFATITDPSGINVAPGTKPRLYYKKSTNANTYVDNTSGTNGWKYVEASNGASPYAFTIDYSLLFGGAGVATGNVIQYFVVAQDLNGTPRIGLNNGGFTLQPTSVALTAANFPITNTVNSYTIVANTYSGVIPVGPTEAITSLTNTGGIFARLNAGVLSGNVTISITGNLTAETAANPLQQWAEVGGSGYTVSIVPSAAAPRLISGSNAALSIIRLDGADRVTIDGRFSGAGNFLTFRNTSNAAPTIAFINDAQNNTLRNCIIESGNTTTTSTGAGAIYIGTTTGPSGNDSLIITDNEIRDRSDIVATPAYLIHCYGNGTTPAQSNNGVVISNNNFHDWFIPNGSQQAAIQLGLGNDGFSIIGNSFYQRTARSHTAAGAVTRVIHFTQPAPATNQGGHNVSGNFIGGSAPGATGNDWILTSSASQSFIGFFLSTGLQPTTIQNNVFRKIAFTSNAPSVASTAFAAIQAGQGNATISGNTIGSATGTGAISITVNAGGTVNTFLAGILAAPGNGAHNITGNTIGGWNISGTAASGAIVPQFIQYQGTPAHDFSISNNLIGSTSTPNSCQNFITAAPSLTFGIRVATISGAMATVSGNIIQNLTDNSTAPASACYGMLFANTVGSTATVNATNNLMKDITAHPSPASPSISVAGIAMQGYSGRNHSLISNTISNLHNANAAAGLGYVMGIQVQGNATGGTIVRNKVEGLRNAQTGASAGIVGIYLSAGDGWQVSNNMVSLTNGTGTNALAVLGIADFSNGLLDLHYNSVYVGGTASGALNSYAFARGGNSRIHLRNNLLYNERAGGPGFHCAIGNLATIPADGWYGHSSDYNTLIASASGRIGEWGPGIGQSFAQWKTSSGGDTASYSDTTLLVPSAALFVNAAAGDLNILTSNQAGWYVNGKGIAGTVSGNTATDFSGNARSTTLGTPTDIGACEFSPNVGVNPIPAIASAAPAVNATTTYTFAGRRLGEITWGPSGTVPTSLVWSYHSGVPPIGAPGSNINSHWELVASGGSGYDYSIRSYYTIHEQNALPDGLINLGKQDGNSPWFYYAGTPSSNAQGKYYDRSGFNSLSNFTLGTSAPSANLSITATVLSGSGTISPSSNVSVLPLNHQSFVIAPAPCFVIDSVFVDGIYIGTPSSYDFTYVSANHTIGVKFRSTAVPATVSIVANPGTSICAGTTVTFTATPVNGGTAPIFQWRVNGLPVGTNSSTYTASGFTTGDIITCELTSSDTCATPATATSNALTITVNPSTSPGAIISVTPGDTLCSSGMAIFTVSVTNGGTAPTFQWTLNGSNVGTNVGNYTNPALANGDVVVCLVTSSDPCAAPQTVLSNAITMTIGDFVSPTAICQNITLSLNGSTGSTTAAAINNNSTDNCSSSGALGLSLSPTTFSCSNSGPNPVTLTVTDAAGNTATCTGTVTVVPQPLAVSVVSPPINCGYQVSCNGANDGTATVTTQGGCPGYTYLWDNGNTTPTATGLGAGLHSVTITDQNNTSIVTTVNLSEPAPITIVSSSTNSCPGDSTGSADITASGGNDCLGYTFSWSNGATTEDLSGVPAGNYTVTVTDVNGCTATSSVTIGSFAVPSPAFTVTGNLLSATQTWSSYQWLLNGIPIPGATGSSHTATQSGDYSLQVTDPNGCTGTSPITNITVVAIDAAAQEFLGLQIYPNPARGEFKLLTINPIHKRLRVSIQDMLGRTLIQQEFRNLSHEATFDIQSLAAGTYMVQVTTISGKRKTFKLVVQ